MNIIRYINGKKVDEKDLKKIEIDNEVILKTIKVVNDRIEENFRLRTLSK